jgi:hypothetical protein
MICLKLYVIRKSLIIPKSGHTKVVYTSSIKAFKTLQFFESICWDRLLIANRHSTIIYIWNQVSTLYNSIMDVIINKSGLRVNTVTILRKKNQHRNNHQYLQDAFNPLKSLKDKGILSLQLLIGIYQQLQFVFQTKLSYPYVRGSCVRRIVDKIRAQYWI